MIDVSDIRRVKFTDCEDTIIDIVVSEVEEIAYPIIVWRKDNEENKIYATFHDREGKHKYQLDNGSVLDLVNKQKRPLNGLEVLFIVEKTNNCVYGISDMEEYKLNNAFIDPMVGWMFKFDSKSRSLHVSPDTINHFFFYFDENGDRAAFEVYE